MKLSSHALLEDLSRRMTTVAATVKTYRDLPHAGLNFKSSSEKWSILECLEHLNLYGDFYLPEIERSIFAGPESDSRSFKPGVLGNYFAKLMQQDPAVNRKKMKAPKDKIPAASELTVTTIDRFLKQAEHLQHLLQLAEKADLTKTKTAISLSKMIRLRLGDTFRFYVYHIERHVKQAERAGTGRR
jgi:hypothetical protein